MLARRGLQLSALTLFVVLAHLWLADGALPSRLGDGADTRPTRLAVTYVRQLAPQAAPAAPVRPAPPAPPRNTARIAAPDLAASAALPAPEPDLPVEKTASLPVPEPAPPLAELAASPAPEAVAAAPAQPTPIAADVAASASAAAPTVVWPPSTRITYRLSGNYRGPIEGQASVEWLRSGTRYQVFMDLSIGPSFAPLMSRRVSSDGEITDKGLRPRRYDEETKVVLRDPRRLTVTMDSDRVLLANGKDVPRPAGLQDSASQFVQLTWLFTTQPDLLQTGRSIEVPLALPRTVEPWIYDVLGSETLYTPAGPVPTVHVKPRREPKPGGDLTAETWVAPSLQYLPVRILIRQDAETWIDLAIDRLPEQAAPGK